MALRRCRRIYWILCLLLLPTIIWSADTTGAPFSRPTAIRENSIYLRTHDEGTNLPPSVGEVFKSVAVERAVDELTIKYRTEGEPKRTLYGAITRHKSSGPEPIQFANGSVRLAYLGVVTKLPPGVEMSRDLVLPPQYFTP